MGPNQSIPENGDISGVNKETKGSPTELENKRKMPLEFMVSELENERMKSKKLMEELEALKESSSLQYLNLNADHQDLKLKYSHLVDELRDKVSCPVCLSLPTAGPVYQCPQGHMVCSDCKGQTFTCPTCRAPMKNIKSLLAVEVINNIEHLCNNAGCSKVFNAEGMSVHKAVCAQRLVVCPAMTCRATLSYSKVEEHINGSCTKVKNRRDVPTSSNKVKLLFKIKKEDGKYKKSRVLNWHNKTFLLNMMQTPELCWHFLVQLMDIQEECLRYEVGISLRAVGGGSSRVKRELGNRSFRGQPAPMEEKGEDYSFGISVITRLEENIILEVTIDFVENMDIVQEEAYVEDGIICEDLGEDIGSGDSDSEVSGSENVTGEDIHNSYDSDW